jgi:hypothetical protein
MVNSRKKGKKAENEVCKILMKYFNGKFERRSMGQTGQDIHCPDGFRYAPEVKHVKTVKAIHLLLGKNKQLHDWWKQACTQAKTYNKEPLLIVKTEGKWMATDMSPDLFHWYPLEIWCKHQI